MLNHSFEIQDKRRVLVLIRNGLYTNIAVCAAKLGKDTIGGKVRFRLVERIITSELLIRNGMQLQFMVSCCDANDCSAQFLVYKLY